MLKKVINYANIAVCTAQIIVAGLWIFVCLGKIKKSKKRLSK